MRLALWPRGILALFILCAIFFDSIIIKLLGMIATVIFTWGLGDDDGY